MAFLDQADTRFGHQISPQQHQQYRHGLGHRVPYGYGWAREASQPPTYAESIPHHLDSRSLKPPGTVVGAPSNPTAAKLRNQADPSISTRVHGKLDVGKYPQLEWPWQWGYAHPTTGDTTVRVIAPINQETREVERASKECGELVACETPLLPTAELKKDAASTCFPTTEAKVRAVSSYLEHAKSAHIPQDQQPKQTFGGAIDRGSRKETQFVGNAAGPIYTDERTRFNGYATSQGDYRPSEQGGGQTDEEGEYDQPTGRATTHAPLSKRAHDEPFGPYTVRMPKSPPDSVETSNRLVTVASTIESLRGLDRSTKPDAPKRDTASDNPGAAFVGLLSKKPSPVQVCEKGVQAGQEHAEDGMLATKKLRKGDGEWVKITPKLQSPDPDLGEGWEKIDGDEEWEVVDSQVIFG